MRAGKTSTACAAAAALLLCRPAAADPPFEPDALGGWRLVRATSELDVVFEGGDCPAALPGAVTRTFVRGEAESWPPGHGEWEPAKILRTDLSEPLALFIIEADGTVRVLPALRLLAFVYAYAGEEHVGECEYIGSESSRASAAELDKTILWPVSLLYEWPGVSGAWMPAHLGPLPQVPKYRADLRDLENPRHERVRLLGAVEPDDVAALRELPQKLPSDAIGAEAAAALRDPMETTILTFSAATDRGMERLWNVQWQGCDDATVGCAWAWGLFRKADGGFAPAYFESGRGESSIDVVLVQAAIDLDLDGTDELLAEHQYYEGWRTDILTWRDGRLVTAYRGSYDGL